MQLQYGAAQRNITPGIPVALHGYSARDHLSAGVSEPLFCGCLALRQAGVTLLVITVDMVGMRADDADAIRSEISECTGVSVEAIMVACSHTHFAPAVGFDFSTAPELGLVEEDRGYTALVKGLIVEAATESLAVLRPGELEVARTRVPAVAFNRRTVMKDGSVVTNFRYPIDTDEFTLRPVDDELTVLKLSDEQGPGACLLNFACHPVTGGDPQEVAHYQVSSDYVYYLRRDIEARYRCPVFFTLGAAGDVVPIDRHGESRRLIGSAIAASALLAARTFRRVESTEGTQAGPFLASGERTLEVETIFPTDGEAERREYEAALAAARSEGSGEPDPESNARFRRAVIRYFRSRLYPSDSFVVRTQFLRIGPLALVALPFEVLSEFALKMKAAFPKSLLVSCANGYQGYLPFTKDYEQGGYEATEDSTHFERGTAERLLELVLDQLSSTFKDDVP